jgi:hypothetical protein
LVEYKIYDQNGNDDVEKCFGFQIRNLEKGYEFYV